MKKIILSLSVIVAIAAIVAGATTAFFSDTETSENNTFTAGTIDIAVDNQNPWHNSWNNTLDKPSQTNYMSFDVKNVGENPANLWKRIANIQTNGGSSDYCGVASSEPEFEEGGGTWDDGTCNFNGYVERKNLASYMVYDMYVCLTDDNNCSWDGSSVPTGDGWVEIISEDDDVRVDSLNGVWIKLLENPLASDQVVRVVQSYHLKAWDDAQEEEIGNWAQGDIMTFDIELEARQSDAPAPNAGQTQATLELVQKDPVTWEPVANGASGTLVYNPSGNEFDYSLSASGLQNSTNYCLIYYADPWPGSNGFEIVCGDTDTGGVLNLSGPVDLGSDMPVSADANYPAGAKLQVVLGDDYDTSSGEMTGWNPSEYLFEQSLIQYDDTNN